MLNPVYIRRFLSCFMLVVFAISITPKRILHDVFAKHNDQKLQECNKTSNQLNNSGYNCDNDNLVAESDYLKDQQVFSFNAFASVTVYILQTIFYSSATSIFASQRGPPVNI